MLLGLVLLLIATAYCYDALYYLYLQTIYIIGDQSNGV